MSQNKKFERNATFAIEEVAEVGLCAHELRFARLCSKMLLRKEYKYKCVDVVLCDAGLVWD